MMEEKYFDNEPLVSIFSHNETTKERYEKALARVKELGIKNIEEISEGNVEFSRRYAGYSRFGVLKKEWIGKITPLELAIVVDGGYNYFGGSTSINKEGNFGVTIYTD